MQVNAQVMLMLPVLKLSSYINIKKKMHPSLRTKLFANNVKYNKLGSIVPTLTNLMLNNILTKKILGIATKRSIPKLANTTLIKWYKKNKVRLSNVIKQMENFIYFVMSLPIIMMFRLVLMLLNY